MNDFLRYLKYKKHVRASSMEDGLISIVLAFFAGLPKRIKRLGIIEGFTQLIIILYSSLKGLDWGIFEEEDTSLLSL